MKYKLIPAALHNFAHSSVSLMNIGEDRWLFIEIVPGLLAETPGGSIRIAFPSGHIAPPAKYRYPRPFVESVGYWGKALAAHLESHKVSLSAVGGEVCVVLEQRDGSPAGWACSVEATDDRGRVYSMPVAHA